MILVDPWGFPEKPSEQEPTNRSGKYKIIYPAVESYVKLFNPFTFMRAVGPYGKCSMKKITSSIAFAHPCNGTTLCSDIYRLGLGDIENHILRLLSKGDLHLLQILILSMIAKTGLFFLFL